ncbi:MAG TPA: glycosyltransferase family 4 protein [Xanthobacteraceae bacterium]|jgi:glycosyltransferase involved in cell wall biosynthesis|nr:glycosyltransferase family 4 protein [Xanthobacteraceae bacterium]
MDARARPAPRLIYVVTEDWYFLSHRLPMARAARAAGFEVHVATNVGEDAANIREEGFILHPVRFARGRLSPLRTVRTILALRRLYRAVNPTIVHYVALQPTLLGIVASFGSKFAVVYGITGLGYAFVADSSKTRSLRRGFRRLLRLGLNRHRAVGLVQNPDDREVLANVGVKPERIALIPGSGIDADRFRPIPEPDGQVTVAFVGRMLADKGVRTLVEAQRILRASSIPCDLLLAGTPDPANPTSIPQIEVAGWGRESGVTWLGHVADIATVWRRAHIAVLPSRGGEGVPKSLLEAAALGRPLIATDVPGCREIVIHEKTGLLVPVDDPQALAAAILRLVRSSQQRVRFGVAARRLVDERFAADLIGRATVALYQRLLTS